MGIPPLLLPQIPSSCVWGVPPVHQMGGMRLSTYFSFKGLAEDRFELHTYISREIFSASLVGLARNAHLYPPLSLWRKEAAQFAAFNYICL